MSHLSILGTTGRFCLSRPNEFWKSEKIDAPVRWYGDEMLKVFLYIFITKI